MNRQNQGKQNQEPQQGVSPYVAQGATKVNADVVPTNMEIYGDGNT